MSGRAVGIPANSETDGASFSGRRPATQRMRRAASVGPSLHHRIGIFFDDFVSRIRPRNGRTAAASSHAMGASPAAPLDADGWRNVARCLGPEDLARLGCVNSFLRDVVHDARVWQPHLAALSKADRVDEHLLRIDAQGQVQAHPHIRLPGIKAPQVYGIFSKPNLLRR